MRVSAWVAPFAMALLFAAVAPAEPQIPGFGKKGDPEKEKKKQEERDAKNLRNYEKLKEFSLNKYRSDPDFKDDVDEAFEELLREHTDRAFNRNTGRASWIRSVHEDNWREHANLYDNLLVQDLVNRIGQKLVPEGSELLYAFKVVPDPIPSAETLATGTIYVSTGMISMLDNEAQLAYVLAHEMAHVAREHWKERIMMEEGADEYAKDQANKRARWALLGTIAGAGIGAATGKSGTAAVAGAAIGLGGGMLAGTLMNRPLIVNWDRVEEDQADEIAFKQVLNANYDVREVPKLYVAMERSLLRDKRVSLGFLGNRKRVEQRKEKAADLIGNAYKADIEVKLKSGKVLGDSAEYRNLIAEVKRDNGIMAYYRDMFDFARRNLEEAIAIRENDPAAHYFYGKVVKLVGRTEDEQKMAAQSFERASQHDFQKQNYGSHLHQALAMIQEKRDFNKEQIRKELDDYVTNYARWNILHWQNRMFPPNLDPIYEYMRLYGDAGWRPKAPDLKDIPDYAPYYLLYEGAASNIVRTAAPVPVRDAPDPAGGTRQLAPAPPPAGGKPVPRAK